jgi:hypothetical protein
MLVWSQSTFGFRAASFQTPGDARPTSKNHYNRPGGGDRYSFGGFPPANGKLRGMAEV